MPAHLIPSRIPAVEFGLLALVVPNRLSSRTRSGVGGGVQGNAMGVADREIDQVALCSGDEATKSFDLPG